MNVSLALALAFLLGMFSQHSSQAQNDLKNFVWESEFSYQVIFSPYALKALLHRDGKPSGFSYDTYIPHMVLTDGLSAKPVVSDFQSFLVTCYRQARQSKVPVYLPGPLGDPTDELLPQPYLDSALMSIDTAYVEDIETQELEQFVIVKKFEEKDLRGALFIQEWHYDQKAHRLIVRPLYTSLNQLVRDEFNGDIRGMRPEMYFRHLPPSSLAHKKGRDFLAPEISWAGQLSTYAFLDRNKNIRNLQPTMRHEYEEKHPDASPVPLRIFDEQLDFQSLKTTMGKTLPSLIFEEAVAGKLEVFSGKNSSTPLSQEQITEAITQRDKFYVENPDTGELEEQIIETRLKPDDIVGLEIKQIWRYEAKKKRLTSNINMVALLVQKNSMITGSLEGFEPVLWVKFED